MTKKFSGVSRRTVVSTIGAAGIATALRPLSVFAQAQPRRPIVGGVIAQPKATNINYSELQKALRALGWIEDQNITFEWRFADGIPARESSLVEEVLRLRPDVFYTGGSRILLLAKRATATIPMVMSGLPMDAQILHELLGPNVGRPAFNVTGVLPADAPSVPLVTQRSAILKELIPGATRFGYVFNVAAADGAVAAKAGAQAAAMAARVTPVNIEIRSLNDLPAAYQSLARERVDAVALIALQWQQNLPLATAARLPTMFTDREAVVQGALIGHFATTPRGAAQVLAAGLVDRILKGAKPADLSPPKLPQPEFKLAVNLATARTLGLTIPPAFLARTDEKIG